jgi:hypothetical protein
MAYLITGHAPGDPTFRTSYERFLRELASLLANAARNRCHGSGEQ